MNDECYELAVSILNHVDFKEEWLNLKKNSKQPVTIDDLMCIVANKFNHTLTTDNEYMHGDFFSCMSKDEFIGYIANRYSNDEMSLQNVTYTYINFNNN